MFGVSDDDYDFDESYNLNFRQYSPQNYFDRDLESDAVDIIQKNRITKQDDSQSLRSVQLFNNQQKEPQKQSKLPPQSSVRVIQIEYATLQKYYDSKIGQKLDTLNLSRNVKTQTSKFLKMLIISRQTSPEEAQAINSYARKNGSLDSYQQLFSFPKLKNKCLQFYRSNIFIRKIIGSNKMQFHTKILLIKYLEKIQANSLAPIKTWKSRKNCEPLFLL